MSTSAPRSVDVVVIGAGQAGLAAAYYLQRRQTQFVVLDERSAVGDVWASRFDALRLFSPAWASGLPGWAWPGNPFRYPGKDEAAAYLRAYAAHFAFPIQLEQRVTQVSLAPGSGYTVTTEAGQLYHTRCVIICTGAYSAPKIPAFAAQLSATVQQLPSRDYRRPAQVAAPGPVAVVGSGNSALQIAADLAAAGREVYVAYREQTPALPNNTAMWVFLTTVGLPRISRHTMLGRQLQQRPEPVVSSDLARLRGLANAHFVGPAVAATAHTLQGHTGSTPPLAAVIWATGYGPDFSWVDLPIFAADGRPQHHRGLTAAPGVAFLGLPWLNSRSSALMGGAGRDARYVVEHLLKST